MEGKKKKKANLVYFWNWDLCVGVVWENQTEQTPERLDLWSCHCRKVTFSLLFTSVLGADLLPVDYYLLWLSKVVVELVSCGTPLWVFRWVRDRHTASPGFFKELFTGFCLAWFDESHIPWHAFASVYTFLFIYFFSHFCILLLWSYFWQGWLIGTYLYRIAQGYANIAGSNGFGEN